MVGNSSSEAVILAGGLGTRLKSLVSDIPKPMVDIGGRPFLEYLLDYLLSQGIEKFIMSVGYKYETILQHFKYSYRTAPISYSVENRPLGTGGGLKKALGMATEKNVFVLNGDSMFTLNLLKLDDVHWKTQADITLGLKEMNNFNRYGTVALKDNRVVGYNEKMFTTKGLINGGVYLIKRNILSDLELPEAFSFEKVILEAGLNILKIAGFASEEYFIDIGIPEDLRKAQKELPLQIKLKGL